MLSLESSVQRGQILSFSLVWLAYFVTYLLRKPLGVVKTDLAAELELSKAELGWCDTALVLPYAGVQIFLPSITDRYSPVLQCYSHSDWATLIGPDPSRYTALIVGTLLYWCQSLCHNNTTQGR